MYYILTKEDCPWCDKAKDLLEKNGEAYKAFLYYDNQMFIRLMMKANLRTVPQIWHETDHIGGYEALELYLTEHADNKD